MSLFSAALDRVIRNKQLNQQQAAAAFGISPSAVTNYLAGRRPAPEQLAQICGALDDDERGQLLTAHLRDELPADYRALVNVTSTGESSVLREEALEAWHSAELPPSTKAAIELIVREAKSDETVRAWLEASADLFR